MGTQAAPAIALAKRRQPRETLSQRGWSSPVTLPGFHEGSRPEEHGRRYPADPPTIVLL